MPKIALEWQRFDELSSAELYEMLRFRQSIFVVEQKSPYPDLDGLDQPAWHLLARTEDALVGYLRLIAMHEPAPPPRPRQGYRWATHPSSLSPRRPGGEGRVRGADENSCGAPHLTLPGAAAPGPLPLPPEGRRGACLRIGRVAVAAPLRGRGLGRRLTDEALSRCREHHPGSTVALSAQVHLVPFYRSFGFEPISGPYDDFGVPHVDMRLRLRN